MAVDEWKESLTKVTDPREALRIIADSANILGGDPYYSDMVSALVQMAERLSATSVDNNARTSQ
jgi:hypothetical protein